MVKVSLWKLFYNEIKFILIIMLQLDDDYDYMDQIESDDSELIY